MTDLDPMDDAAYVDDALEPLACAFNQCRDLKALVRDQAAEIERRTLRHAQHVEAFQEVAKDNERLEAENARLKETAHSDRTKLFEENRALVTALEAAEALVRELRAALDKLVYEFNNHVKNVRSDPEGADFYVPHLEALEARDAAVKVLAKSAGPGEKNG